MAIEWSCPPCDPHNTFCCHCRGQAVRRSASAEAAAASFPGCFWFANQRCRRPCSSTPARARALTAPTGSQRPADPPSWLPKLGFRRWNTRRQVKGLVEREHADTAQARRRDKTEDDRQAASARGRGKRRRWNLARRARECALPAAMDTTSTDAEPTPDTSCGEL
eukprot:3178571-Rhodomonas_salina.3